VKRATKLVFHEHRIVCPYCRTALIFNSPMEVILSIADAVCAGGPIASCDDKKVIVTIVNYPLYKGKLLFTGGRKKLHPSGNAVRSTTA